MNEQAIHTLGAILAISAFFIGIPIWQVRLMSKPEKLLVRNKKNENKIIDLVGDENIEWIDNAKYDYVGAFTFQLIDLLVWADPKLQTCLVIYLARGKMKTDIVSELTDAKSLTTGNAKDGHLFPSRKGDYKELLDISLIESLYAQHLRSIDQLNCTRLQRSSETWDFEACIVDAIKKEMEYAQSHRMWPIRFWGWFLFRRNKYWNKTIEQQFTLNYTQ